MDNLKSQAQERKRNIYSATEMHLNMLTILVRIKSNSSCWALLTDMKTTSCSLIWGETNLQVSFKSYFKYRSNWTTQLNEILFVQLPPEFKLYARLCCYIQKTTTLNHAWQSMAGQSKGFAWGSTSVASHGSHYVHDGVSNVSQQ